MLLAYLAFPIQNRYNQSFPAHKVVVYEVDSDIKKEFVTNFN